MLTAKDKADEIFNKFWNLCPSGYDRMPYRKYAKKCAIIAVEEIIKEWEKGDSTDYLWEQNYWRKVKQEIEKL